MHAGLFVDMIITIDAASWDNDSPAFGACINDLQREGWQLKDLVREDGGAKARLGRRWVLRGPRFGEDGEGETATTMEADHAK